MQILIFADIHCWPFDTVLVVQAIHQIRLILRDNNTVVDIGETYALDTPSGQTSGLKIPVNITLQL